jgi:glycerol-3-phosphate acyltransferase PlsX
MRLALDAMGGDDAPRAMVQGALDYAIAHPNHQVILVGRQADLTAAIAVEGGSGRTNVVIADAPQVISMSAKIAALKEFPNDSMNRTALLVKEGKADAMVLCGNTGCSVAAAQLHLRRIPGVKRAGILVSLPNPRGHTWICDGGANAVCRPEHLVQFAEMGAAFLETVLGVSRPKVGVLSIGEEDEKGVELTQETRELLRQTTLNVVGNVEGHDIYSGELDVVVCDGFVGNIVLKTSEGVAEGIAKILKEEIHKGFLTTLGGALVRPAFRGLKRRVDWRHVGGCPLLGVDGVCIIGHGRSDRTAITNALGQAARFAEARLVDRLREHFRNQAATVAAAQ